jgi:hypothetical protein
LNEQEFKALCDACDALLVENNASTARMAISWLHIIREHPVFLKNYERLFPSSIPLETIRNRLLQKVRRVASGIKLLADALTFRESTLPRICSELKRVDVLFVSHLINESHLGSSSDFYFGDIPKKLASKGYTVAVALIDHTHSSRLPKSSCWEIDNVKRFLLPRISCISDEIEFKNSLRVESKKLRKWAKSATSGLGKRVAYFAADQATSNGNSANLRIGRFVGVINAILQPKLMVVTHEGHSWERLAFSGARKTNPMVYCVGYQHAALFKLQHAIRRKLAQQYNPDMILTSGSVAMRQMELSGAAAGTPIAVLGSNRGSQKTFTPHKLSQTITCLVLPEGVESECNLLFEFSLDCANAMPSVLFVWRTHPLLSFEMLSRKNPKLRNLPGNVFVSNSTLLDDASKSQFALYRGTTAIVSMVTSGLRPIYLKVPGEMTIDPLYELLHWKAVVTTVADFYRSVASSELHNMDDEFEYLFAQKYCLEFYLPIDIAVLEKVLHGIENVDQA